MLHLLCVLILCLLFVGLSPITVECCIYDLKKCFKLDSALANFKIYSKLYKTLLQTVRKVKQEKKGYILFFYSFKNAQSDLTGISCKVSSKILISRKDFSNRFNYGTVLHLELFPKKKKSYFNRKLLNVSILCYYLKANMYRL